jgi:RecA/RadA recombinase
MAKQTKDKTETVDSVKMAAVNFFKSNEQDIYINGVEPYKVSTGVMALDSILDGGITSGLTRLLGPPTSGKSSSGLLIIKNFLETRPRARALIVPTESRLTAKLMGRSGVKFVTDPKDWVNKTCLVLPMNKYEKFANFVNTLVMTNHLHEPENRENFAIMVDCMDYLTLEGDLEKEFGEARRVAGPQYLTKMFWSKMSLPFISDGHMFLALSQQSAAPKLDPYSKDPLRQGGSSGGTNIQYQATTVIDFSQRYEGDYILEDDDAKYDPKKNKKIGHIVKGYIRKSDNEKYDVKFEYAIKYGRVDGNSLWVEKDVTDQLLSWNFLTRESAKGSFTFEKSLHEELLKVDPNVPEKIRSVDGICAYLESNPKVCQYLVEKFRKVLV